MRLSLEKCQNIVNNSDEVLLSFDDNSIIKPVINIIYNFRADLFLFDNFIQYLFHL